jgi:hypothetical protein
MRLLRRLIVVGLLLTIGGCSIFEAKETTFLRGAKNHATQEEVKRELGPPKLMKATQSGDSIWVYQIWDWQPGNRLSAPGGWCDEYILTFDHQDILRRWTHKNYFHGGEAFPTYCVPDRYYSSDS